MQSRPGGTFRRNRHLCPHPLDPAGGILLLALILAPCATAISSPGAENGAKPPLVLALSGGGARGLAHVGVLQVLDSASVEIGGIAGVSVGALVGALYSCGWNGRDIEMHLRAVDWNEIFLDQPERRSLPLARRANQSRHLVTLRLGEDLTPIVPAAISPGQALYDRLLWLTLQLPARSSKHWDDLPVPLRIVATDLVTGSMVVIERGDPAPSVRGSMALPLLFDPLPYGDSLLIDGGIAENIPVSAARQLGSIVIAVDATSPLKPAGLPYQPWQIVDQVTTILERETMANSLAGADLIIRPELGDLASAPVEAFDDFLEAGREAARKALPGILHLLEERASRDTAASAAALSPANPTVLRRVVLIGCRMLDSRDLLSRFDALSGQNYDSIAVAGVCRIIERRYREAGYPVAEVARKSFDPATGTLVVTVDEGRLGDIQFIGLERVPTTGLEREIPLRRGKVITREGVRKAAANLYATGLFRGVYPSLERTGGPGSAWMLRVQIIEYPAPQVRLGLAYHDEQGARGFAEVSLPSPANYAARLSLFTSPGQRDVRHSLSSEADRFFGYPATFSLEGHYRWRERDIYDQYHARVGSYREWRGGAIVKVGGEAPDWGGLRITGRWEEHQGRYGASRPNRTSEQYTLLALGGELALDTEDRRPYPNQGVSAGLSFETAVRPLTDADRIGREFWQTRFYWESFATPKYRHTLGLRLKGVTSSPQTPFDERPRLGGLESFPGLHLDQLTGKHQLSGGAEFRYDLLSRIVADSYVGIRFDTGATWDNPPRVFEQREWLFGAAIYFAFDTVFGPLHLQLGHLFPSGGIASQTLLSLQAGNAF